MNRFENAPPDQPRSYSRRKRGYIYEVEILEVPTTSRHVARVVHMVLLKAGSPVTVCPGLQEEYGSTPDEAFSKIDAAVEKWVKGQSPSSDPRTSHFDAVLENSE